MRQIAIAFVCLMTSCGPDHAPKSPKESAKVGELRDVYNKALNEARALQDPTTGWITPTDCDGMLWTGKYAAATGVSGVNLAAAEVEPGRFDRRPPPPCTSANPNWSSFSRDMGTGVLAAAWRTKDLGMLERHADYGRAHNWRMGEPVGDGRSIYTPAMLGRLFQIIYALGGEDSLDRHWPDLYPKGLVDFQAHLQVMGIWLVGEVDEEMKKAGKSGDAMPHDEPIIDDPAPEGPGLLDVTDSQFEILKSQAARDPKDPLFQGVLGIYTGDMEPALDACLAPDQYAGEYVRCDEFRRCQLAAWIFACDVVLRRFQ